MKIFIFCLAIYGILFIISVGVRIPSAKRKNTTGIHLIWSRETRLLKEQVGKETKKREKKKDTLTLIAKQKPDRIALALKKWIIERNGNSAH